MKRKCRVRLPKAAAGMNFSMPTAAHPAYKGSVLAPGVYTYPSDAAGKEDTKINRTLKPVDREYANLEAEKGETVVTNLSGGGIPEFYNIGGKRHYDGGTPLNLPQDSFIFSRDRAMKIKDPEILAQFGKTVTKKKKWYLPAEISKAFSNEKPQQILLDPHSTKLERDTAELMIQNNNYKLGGLALVQESMKGFPDGIPGIAMPYLQANGIDPKEFLQTPGQEQEDQDEAYEGEDMARYGKSLPRHQTNGITGTPGPFELQFKERSIAGDFLRGIGPDAWIAGMTGATMFSPAENRRRREIEEMNKALRLPDSFVQSRDLADASEGFQTVNTGVTAPTDKVVYDPSNQFRNIGPASSTPFVKYGGSNFTPHMMYHPDTEEGVMAETYEDHLEYQNKGYMHEDEMRYGGSPNADAIKRIEPKSGSKSWAKFPSLVSAKYGGTPNQKRKVRVTMPKYQGGGQTAGADISTSNRPTRYQNIPKNVDKWDPTKPGYDEASVKVGDYIKEDGVWKVVTGYKNKPYTGTFKDERLVGELGDLQEEYGRLEEALADPELRKAIVAEYRKVMAQVRPRPNTTGLTQAQIDIAKNLSEEQIIANMMEMEKQVFATNANLKMGENWDPEDSWDKSRDNYTKTITKLGFKPLDVAHQAAFQGAYVAMQKVSKNPKYKKKLEDFAVTPEGRSDEKGGGTGIATISDIDGWVGNTTIGQAALYKPKSREMQTAEADWISEEQEKQNVIRGINPAYAVQEYTPPFPEDVAITSNAVLNRMLAAKEDPTLIQYDPRYASPTSLDPQRMIAGIGSQYTTAADRLAAYATPGAGRAGILAGAAKSAELVGDTIGKVQKYNVDTMNKFELANAQIYNEAALANAKLRSKYWDEVATVNDNFRKEKMGLRTEATRQYGSLLKNQRDLAIANTLAEQYHIDPWNVGDPMRFTYGRPLQPKKPATTGVVDKAAEYKRLYPDMTWGEATSLAKADKGIPDVSPYAGYGINPAQFAYPGMTPGA